MEQDMDTAISPQTAPTYVYRQDYREPDFHIPYTDLVVDLDLDRTLVRSRLRVRRNDAVNPGGRSLRLNGEGLRLTSVTLDGEPLGRDRYEIDDSYLTILEPPDVFILETCVEITPRGNSSMMGLGISRDGEYFTNFEAEGFRKFTYFLDRPDVLSTFTVKLIADKTKVPVLVASGNPSGSGELPEGRHYAVFHDPHPKPCYILAIVAGNLARISDVYVTQSHREIDVGVYANEAYIEQCTESLNIIIDAMRWDETNFSREYDLDVFNCAVLNGGAGAMENKGLNIYDLNWFITDARITPDNDFEYRKKTIAHEYFHNWSGNRVTNQSWFYVSLKEGFTRFREQLYLADFAGTGPVRIRMTKHIRNNQFTEDDSSVAHAPIWESYIEPRNLYTNTVYDKGQEIIQMLLAMVGREAFCKISSWYFDEYATKAVTIDEFLGAFERMGQLDLSQFRKWYWQAGTCEITAIGAYDQAASSFTVKLSQKTRPTKNQQDKEAMHVPISVALIGPDGEQVPFKLEGAGALQTGQVLQLRDWEQEWRLTGVTVEPVLSVLREACAPVRLHYSPGAEKLAHLFKHDTDGFARWDAGQRLGTQTLQAMALDFHSGKDLVAHPSFMEAIAHILADREVDDRMRAELLSLPEERTLGAESYPIDVDGIHASREALMAQISLTFRDQLLKHYEATKSGDFFDLSSKAIGRRRLKNVALDLLVKSKDPALLQLALDQVREGGNITDQVSALTALCNVGGDEAAEALAVFRKRWSHEQLVMDRMFRAQISAARSDTASITDALMNSSDFDVRMFSRLYTFAEAFFYENRYGLNEPGGSGYEMAARQILNIDKVIPFVSNWLLNRCDLNRWQLFDAGRQAMMRQALQTMIDEPGISPGLYEICSKSLAEKT
jgi:aminopeptidase N